MRVFVTGGSGFIGSAVIPELIGAGHEVLALARSDASAAAVADLGAEVHRGALDDLDSLRAGAQASDGVAHLAFIHDFSQIEESGRADLRAIEAFGEVLAGTGKPLAVTSGTGLLAAGGMSEDDLPELGGMASHRAPSEHATVALADRGVRSVLVRLPPSVHGEGDHGFVPILIAIAREKGSAGYVGDGSNRWAAVHRLDAARLFRLALESATPGSAVHGVGDEGVPTRAIAETFSRHLGIPAESIAPEDAFEHFGWLGGFFAADMRASAELTRDRLHWEPTRAGLIADLEEGHYFAPVPA
jgi:nucleoside-diphosphate-sugar epimerase